jgi:hypothetical protein
VEDDGSEGVPELPVAFSMSSHQDLSHHFKIVCQLFVHLAVRSPSQRVSFMRDVEAGEHINVIQNSFHMIPDRSFSRRCLLLWPLVNGPAKDHGDAGLVDHFIDLANGFQESAREISRAQHGEHGFCGAWL